MWSPLLPGRLGLPFAAHPHAPLPRLVDVAQLFLAVGDLTAGREVGPLDVLEEVLRLQLGIVEHRDGRRADLAQVVGRDVGRHADGNPGAAVDEQLRHLGRQHDRLLGRAVVVGAEVDRPLLDLVEQIHRQRRQARLGVAVGGRRVAVERAEVAVAVDQRDAHRERLRHAHHRFVAGESPCGWNLPSTSPTIGRRLAELGVRVEVQVGVHRVENPPLHRLEAVAHIGERARGDDADRVVQVAPLRLEHQRRVGRRRRIVATAAARARRACGRGHRRRRRPSHWAWRRPR